MEWYGSSQNTTIETLKSRQSDKLILHDAQSIRHNYKIGVTQTQNQVHGQPNITADIKQECNMLVTTMVYHTVQQSLCILRQYNYVKQDRRLS